MAREQMFDTAGKLVEEGALDLSALGDLAEVWDDLDTGSITAENV